MCIIKDLWDTKNNLPLPWYVIKTRYELDNREKIHVDNLIIVIQAQWPHLLQHPMRQAPRGSWLGCFDFLEEDIMEEVLFHSCELFNPVLDELSLALFPHLPCNVSKSLPIQKSLTKETQHYGIHNEGKVVLNGLGYGHLQRTS